MGEKKQIHIRIDEEDKQRWETYADENDDIYNGSLTTLIKRAVNHEISDTWVLETEEQSEVDFEPVQDDLTELKEDLEYVKETLDQLERSTGGNGEEFDREQALDLGSQIHDMLPYVSRDEEPPPMDPEEVSEYKRAGLPSELADELDVPEFHVRKALLELQKGLSNIKTRQKGDTRQWYVEGP